MTEHGLAGVEIRIFFLHCQLKLEVKANLFPSEHKKELCSLETCNKFRAHSTLWKFLRF